MAFEAKALLLGEMERRLANTLTVEIMSKVLSELADSLACYKIEYTASESAETDDLLEAYMNALKVEGRSSKTVERYKYIIEKFSRTINVTTRNVTVYHIRNYFAKEKERGISDRTIEGNRQVFSAYFNWLQREGLIIKNPTANLGAVKYQKKQKEIYSELDIERLKFGCDCERDLAIVCFLRATGCRVSEMTGLNRDDVDLTNLECKVLGKGNKERIVFLDRVSAMNLQMYLNTRKDNRPALFIGEHGQRLNPNGVRAMLKRLEEKTDVKHVHPHKFRRTTATNLIRHGMPIQEVAAILGHEKLDTTMQYVVMNKDDIKNSYQKHA